MGREIPETVNHLVLNCPAYEDERDTMAKKIGHSSTPELKRIFATEEGIEELLNFLDSTKRFRNTLGRLNIRDTREKRQEKTAGDVNKPLTLTLLIGHRQRSSLDDISETRLGGHSCSPAP